MKRYVLLLVTIIALNYTLSAQMVVIDARSLNIYNGKPKMVIQKDNANDQIVAHLDTNGKVTMLEYHGNKLTYSWRPDGKRITCACESEGETTYDYINIIEYSDTISHYEVWGYNTKKTFDSLGREVTTDISEANGWIKVNYTYVEGSSASVPICIEATNSNGSTLHQDVIDIKYDDYGNYTEYTTITNGAKTKMKRKIYYY